MSGKTGFDAAQFVGHVFQCPGGDLLANDLALVPDPEKHKAAQAVGQVRKRSWQLRFAGRWTA